MLVVVMMMLMPVLMLMLMLIIVLVLMLMLMIVLVLMLMLMIVLMLVLFTRAAATMYMRLFCHVSLLHFIPFLAFLSFFIACKVTTCLLQRGCILKVKR